MAIPPTRAQFMATVWLAHTQTHTHTHGHLEPIDPNTHMATWYKYTHNIFTNWTTSESPCGWIKYVLSDITIREALHPVWYRCCHYILGHGATSQPEKSSSEPEWQTASTITDGWPSLWTQSPSMVNMITCKHIPDRLFWDFTLDVQNSCTHHADFTILPKTHRNDDNDINICAGDRRDNREEKDTDLPGTDSKRTRQTSRSLTHSTTPKKQIEGWTAGCEKSGISSTATLDGLCIHVQPSKTINKKGTGSDRFGRQLLVDDGL